MRVIKPRRTFAATGALLCSFGIAAAQPADQPGSAAAPPVAEVQAPQEVELTPEQQLEKGNEHLAGMERDAASVRHMLEEARAARDVVKVLCLNDKVSQMNVANRSAKDRMDSLRAAVGRKDVDRARHEFTVLQVLKDRVSTLNSEAKQCIGEETGFVGDTQVSVDVDPNIPDVDPDQLGIDPEVIIETPVLSSPIQ